MKEKNCPVCGKPAHYAGTAVRGSVGAYWYSDMWRCADGYKCDYSGMPIFEDDTPESVIELVKLNQVRFTKYRWLREVRAKAA